MPGTKRVINIGTNPDDGTGDLLRDALNKVNLNFDDVWEYTSVNSNLNITGDSINGTTDVIINPADTGAFKVTGDTIINPDGGNYNFTINGDLHNNVLYVQASTGRIGVHNTSPTVTLDITGDTKVSGMTTANNLTVTGNTILGDANTDTVTYNAKAASNFLPYSTTQNIGAPSNRWGYIYTTNLDVTGTIAGTFTGSMTSTLTGDVNNTNVTTVNANVTGPSNLTDVNISGNLVVQGSTTTLETTQVMVDNSIVFEGATDDAFETTLAITDPTADRTFTFPDATGTVATQEWANAQGFGGSGPSDTDALNEGSTNLYFTNTRADARITAAGSANWNTAYGWGDHGTAGYLTSVPAQSFASLTGKPTTIAGYGITDAFDGDYNNLSNKPSIPSAYTNSDVDAHLNQSNPTSGHVLSWNGSDYAWVANAGGISDTDSLPEGTSNLYYTDTRFDARLQTRNISNLADVNTTGASDGQAFVWSSSNSRWQPGSVSYTNFNTDFDTRIATKNIGTLADVDTSGASNGQALAWSSSNSRWEPLTISGGSYSNSDVDTHLNQSNPTAGYVLTWNGSDYAWTANGTGSGLGDVVDDTTPQLGGNLDGQSYNITTTGKILYSNVYSQTTDLPSASTYHGMFAHVHATGKGYFAHGGNWVALANESALSSYQTTAGLNAAIDSHLNQSNPTSGNVLSWNGSDYAWVANSTTFGLAGNTGTHTFNPATETLTFLGTTGQINAGIAANNVTLELASDINSITSISFEGSTADANETKLQAVDPTADNTINLPDASGTVALTSDIPTAYTDSSVDTHLNTSSAGTNEVLSWTGSDYDWVAQSTVPLQVIDTKTSDYTPTSSDHAKYLRVNSSSTVTITLVNDSTDAIAVGTMFIVGRAGSGSVNFSAGSGATIYSISGSLGISPQHGKATVLKVATDTWEVSGNLA